MAIIMILLILIQIGAQEATTYIERFEQDWRNYDSCNSDCNGIAAKVTLPWKDPVPKQYQGHQVPSCKKVDSCTVANKKCRYSKSTEPDLLEWYWMRWPWWCECCRCRCTYGQSK